MFTWLIIALVIYALIAGSVFGATFIFFGFFPKPGPYMLQALILSLLAGIFWFISIPWFLISYFTVKDAAGENMP